jgi:tRNA U55 pseudouridine synthase TruB
MKSLIRTKQGNFNIENSYTLKDIEDGNYKFVDIINFLDYPTYELNDELLKKVLNGSKVSLNIDFDKVLLKYNEEIIAIYVKENDIYKPHIMLKTN